jgi:hypothetical protein
VVQSPERNIFDQRHLEYQLKISASPIPVFRLPFADILSQTSIADTPKRQLLYHSPSNPSKTFEVSVVYFRAGYGPSDYPNEAAWKARLHIERSNAIKCPTILTQLSGAKKVQQVLAAPTSPSTPSILNRFTQNTPHETSALEKTFTTHWTPALLASPPVKLPRTLLSAKAMSSNHNAKVVGTTFIAPLFHLSLHLYQKHTGNPSY